MKRISLLALQSLLVGSMLSGCALWKDFTEQKTAVPDKWNTSVDKDAKAEWPDAQWWKQFGSPRLTAMTEEANQSNFDLQAAIARVKQADAQVRISGASLLPSIEAGADASRRRTSGSSSSASGLGISTRPHISNAHDVTLSAAYELDFWGKNYAAQQSAEALAEASRFDRETVALTVTSSVAETYFDILATQARLKVARENLDNAGKLLQSIRNRFKLGVGTALDVAQQESVVASQRAAVPPLEQHLQQSINAQAILLGKMPEEQGLAGVAATPAEKLSDIAIPTVVAGLPSKLLQRRPDVQNAEAQLKAAHADIIVARGQMFPSIQLTAAGGYESAALAKLFNPDSMLWSVGAGLTQPIFEGGRLFGALDLRKARYEELVQNYRKAVASAFADVENALVAVKQGDEEEKAQTYAVETARRAYQLSQRQMEGGIVDITTVLDVQRTLFSAQDALVQAKLLHLQAMVGLYKALGGGWNAGTDEPVNIEHDVDEAITPLPTSQTAPPVPESKP